MRQHTSGGGISADAAASCLVEILLNPLQRGFVLIEFRSRLQKETLF